MNYLEVDEVLFIHSVILETSSGSHGVRDKGALAGTLSKPQTAFGGQEMYVGYFIKAAVYIEGIARLHPFVDGNKRTAFTAAVRFLEKNSYSVTISNEEVVSFMVSVVTEKKTVAQIAAWLEKSSRLTE